MNKPRDYRKEYDTYHGKPEQVGNRSSRNKARRKVKAAVGESKIRGKDIDHKNGNPKDNRKSNLRVMNKSKNRSKK